MSSTHTGPAGFYHMVNDDQPGIRREELKVYGLHLYKIVNKNSQNSLYTLFGQSIGYWGFEPKTGTLEIVHERNAYEK